MKKTLGITMAAAVLAAGVGWASAQPQVGGQGKGRGQRMADTLGLSEEQKATWASLHEQHKTEMAPLREEGRGLRNSLRSAIGAANPDPTAVGNAALAMKEYRNKMRAAEEAFHTHLASTLNDEQKAKFDALKAAHHGGRWFRGYRGHKPAGPDASSSAPQAPVEG
jgi:Spy/CpxP family protein refolding chaperone